MSQDSAGHLTLLALFPWLSGWGCRALSMPIKGLAGEGGGSGIAGTGKGV